MIIQLPNSPNLLKKSIKYKKHILKLGFGVLIIVIFLKWAKFEDYSFIKKSITNHNFWYGCLILFLVQVFKAIRFQILLSEYKINFFFTKNLFIHLIVPIAGLVTPSKSGELLKVFLIGQQKKKVGFCFLLERLIDLVILLLISSFVIWHHSNLFKSFFIVIPLILILFICIIYFDRIINFFFARYGINLEKNWFIENLKLFLKPKHIPTFLIGVMAVPINIYASYQFSLNAGSSFQELSMIQFAPILTSSMFIGLLSGLPGGIGSREVAISYIYHEVFNIDILTGSTFALINLFGTYLTFVVCWIFGYVGLKLFRYVFKDW